MVLGVAGPIVILAASFPVAFYSRWLLGRPAHERMPSLAQAMWKSRLHHDMDGSQGCEQRATVGKQQG